MGGPKIQKLYYSTHEISEEVKVPPYVLRTWELKYPYLNPPKSKSGRRMYRESDLNLVLMIKKFKDAGQSDMKIRNLLIERRRGKRRRNEDSVDNIQKRNLNQKMLSEIDTGLRDILTTIDGA